MMCCMDVVGGRGPLHIADINTIAGDDTSHGWGQLIRLTTLHSTVRTAVKPINYTQFQIVHFKQKFKIRGQLDQSVRPCLEFVVFINMK